MAVTCEMGDAENMVAMRFSSSLNASLIESNATPIDSTLHHSGMSVVPTMLHVASEAVALATNSVVNDYTHLLMLMTGLRRTPVLKRSGYWPTKCAVKKPPWLPPVTPSRFSSATPGCQQAISSRVRIACAERERETYIGGNKVVQGSDRVLYVLSTTLATQTLERRLTKAKRAAIVHFQGTND